MVTPLILFETCFLKHGYDFQLIFDISMVHRCPLLNVLAGKEPFNFVVVGFCDPNKFVAEQLVNYLGLAADDSSSEAISLLERLHEG